MNHRTLLIALLTFCCAAAGHAAPANLTRHLVEIQRTEAQADEHTASFFATAGDASVAVKSSAEELPITIIVNGERLDTQIANPAGITSQVMLKAGAGNQITVVLRGPNQGSAQVRITQQADLDFQFTGYVTYAGNTFDFERSVDFYAKLGWTTKQGGFPKTNTPEMGHALGADGPYTMRDGALLILT